MDSRERERGRERETRDDTNGSSSIGQWRGGGGYLYARRQTSWRARNGEKKKSHTIIWSCIQCQSPIDDHNNNNRPRCRRYVCLLVLFYAFSYRIDSREPLVVRTRTDQNVYFIFLYYKNIVNRGWGIGHKTYTCIVRGVDHVRVMLLLLLLRERHTAGFPEISNFDRKTINKNVLITRSR